MEIVLRSHQKTKLIEEEIENLNRLVSKETELTFSNIATKKRSESDGFTCEFYQLCKKEIIPIFHKLRKQRRKHFSAHSMRSTPAKVLGE